METSLAARFGDEYC